MINRFSAAIAVAVCFLASPSVFAITRTWTGATSAKWSEPANWSPAGVPDPSDSLVLGAGKSNVMINDLPAGTRVGPISVSPSDGFILTGNSLTLTGPVSDSFTTSWNVDLKMEADVTLPGNAFHGALDLNGHTVALHTYGTKSFVRIPAPIDGSIIGPGELVIWGAPAKITNPSSFSGTIHVQNSLDLYASMPNANFIVDGELKGSGGTVGSLSGLGNIDPGLYDPNFNPQFATFRTRSLTLDGGYVANVNFYTPISDRLEVTGTVRLSGSLYPVTGIPGSPWPLGREVVIIDNQGTGAVIGTFKDLPEGALISADGFQLKVSYHGGDGNDVTLTDVAYGKIFTGACSHLWSNPCNWSPATAPIPGEILDFSAHRVGGNPLFNDLPAGFAVGGLTVNGDYLDGNPITLVGDITAGPSGAGLRMPVTLGASVHIRADVFNLLNMNGHSATFEWPTVIAELDGDGSIPPASLQVAGGSFSGTLSGTLVLGNLPNANVAGITHLSGYDSNSKVANIVIAAGGAIDPGNTTNYSPSYAGTVAATSLSLAGTYDCDFVGNKSDQIIVEGPVSLSGPLNVVVRTGGQTLPFFTIIDNRGSAPVSGNFSGLPEGATLQVGSAIFTITYRGGDGNDVVLLSGPSPVLALSQSASETVFGEPFTIRANVSGSATEVAFGDGLIALGAAAPNRGVATFDVAKLGIGTHEITATFGTATAAITHQVRRGLTALLVTGSVGQVAVVTAIVRPVSPAAGVPGGVVSIDVDGARVGTVPLSDGTATISIPTLSPGKHTITAYYAGDSRFEPGNSSSQFVTAPPRGRSVRH
jgi:hypothetical protein